MPSHQTVIGILTSGLVVGWYLFLARRRYKCPRCGRIVRYKDDTCPHCGDDMKGRHRAGPEALPRAAKGINRRSPR